MPKFATRHSHSCLPTCILSINIGGPQLTCKLHSWFSGIQTSFIEKNSTVDGYVTHMIVSRLGGCKTLFPRCLACKYTCVTWCIGRWKWSIHTYAHMHNPALQCSNLSISVYQVLSLFCFLLSVQSSKVT